MWNGDGEDHVVALVEDAWFRERIIRAAPIAAGDPVRVGSLEFVA